MYSFVSKCEERDHNPLDILIESISPHMYPSKNSSDTVFFFGLTSAV